MRRTIACFLCACPAATFAATTGAGTGAVDVLSQPEPVIAQEDYQFSFGPAEDDRAEDHQEYLEYDDQMRVATPGSGLNGHAIRGDFNRDGFDDVVVFSDPQNDYAFSLMILEGRESGELDIAAALLEQFPAKLGEGLVTRSDTSFSFQTGAAVRNEMWLQTYFIAYRDGAYVVAGMEFRDETFPQSEDSDDWSWSTCSVNFRSGRVEDALMPGSDFEESHSWPIAPEHFTLLQVHEAAARAGVLCEGRG